jgi:hypothetical protein
MARPLGKGDTFVTNFIFLIMLDMWIRCVASQTNLFSGLQCSACELFLRNVEIRKVNRYVKEIKLEHNN